MITPEYCRLMARYNRWMNERLYEVLGPMTDEDRKEVRGAFFGSMHETLNHLLWGDRMWLGRFIGEPCEVGDFGRGMFGAFADLARERAVTDYKIVQWAADVDADWLDAPLRYRSRVDGKERELPGAIAAVHLFNHATHHRGQLTTLLSQSGRDPGITDLPWLPGVVRVLEK